MIDDNENDNEEEENEETETEIRIQRLFPSPVRPYNHPNIYQFIQQRGTKRNDFGHLIHISF